MKKLVKGIITTVILNRGVFLSIAILVGIIGGICFKTQTIDVYPDITPTQVIITTQWTGKSAEEVERLITIPLELSLNSVQQKTVMHSITMFGLSQITVLFSDEVDDFHARSNVINALANVQLPQGVTPYVAPPYSPVGEIYRFTVESKTRSKMELKTLEDWVIDHKLREADGVADINTYGGQNKMYEVAVNPFLLNKYGLTAMDVFTALSNSNVNSGGDYIEQGQQSYAVRGIGLIKGIDDIKNIVIKVSNGVPVYVKNVAEVDISMLQRLGRVGISRRQGDSIYSDDDVTMGVVVMRKGEDPAKVLRNVEEKVKELNTIILPPDVKIVPHYKRSDLINYATHTVLRNLFEGIFLVVAIVFLFLADWRTTLIVSIIIPLSLGFAFICMKLKGMPVNLLSLGAIDFGIIIDGAVVIVEGCVVAFDKKYKELGRDRFNKMRKHSIIRDIVMDRGSSIVFAKFIILLALFPIFSFQEVEGKIFSPLAYTLGFAMLGAVFFYITLVPPLMCFLLQKDVYNKSNFITDFIVRAYSRVFQIAFKRKRVVLISAIALLGISIYVTKFVGSEFLPHLDEGGMWIKAQLPFGISLHDATNFSDSMRHDLVSFPQVKTVVTQTGRPDDGSDPEAFSDIQNNVILYPEDQWKPHISKDSLTNEMSNLLNRKYPGVVFNFSQYIRDNFEQAVSGFNAALAARITGPDLTVLNNLAEKVNERLKNVRGMEDVGILKNIGQPEVNIELDEHKMALYGVTASAATTIIQMIIAGIPATEVHEGERLFDLRVRYAPEYRKDIEQLGNIMVPTINGGRIPLKEIAQIEKSTGISFIYRDNNMRMIGVKFSCRGRDLGSTIADGQDKIKDIIESLPKGYTITWVGEYQDKMRAQRHLAIVVPICLVLVLLTLLLVFRSVKLTLLYFINVPFALVGGIFALLITQTNFSISAGIGFIALIGVSIQNGIILMKQFMHNLSEKQSLHDAIYNGVHERLRPVLMTAFIDISGLIPAALSLAIGSEAQKPIAIVMIGGLISDVLLQVFVLPVIYYVVNRSKYEHPGS